MSTCNSVLRTLPKASTCRQTFSQLNPVVTQVHQIRNASTTRRHKKLLHLPESPSYTPDRSSPTLIFNPPSSAPNIYHTPPKFLPKTDSRQKLYTMALNYANHASLRTSTPSTASPGTPLHSSSSTSSHLPPRPSTTLPSPVRPIYEKKYHLTDVEINEIRRLRAEDPDKWTRVRLAEKFGCSQFFVGMVAKNEEKAERVASEHQAMRERWGTRRRMAREDRNRRRELWGRDA